MSSLATNDRWIAILRSVSILTDTPEDDLHVLASLLEPVSAEADEVIVRKGERGDCLYIIAEGSVRVQDGDRILGVLGAREVFGEMSALDPEPRSATVTAAVDTNLLRLRNDALITLIAERPAVAMGFIHLLAQRLRSANREMVSDFDYMQQFQRVIAAALAVESGSYDPGSLDEVAVRGDDLGQLARVFQRMARQVDLREQRLKQEVAELRIEIDQARQARQVAEITESDYFQNLQGKITQLRSRREHGSTADKSQTGSKEANS